jgi:CHAD domain-containing protein
VRDLQDLLGDIHDRDVQGPLLAEHLGRLRGPQGEAERPGVAALLSRCRSERDDLYARFLRRWERLADDAFRARLEGALGIR